MAYLDRDGVRIYYEVHGSGSRGSAEPWLQRDVCDVDRQIGPLSAKHKLIIWDMRGHGNSDSPANPADYSEALTTGDMAALLDAADARHGRDRRACRWAATCRCRSTWLIRIAFAR